MSDYIDHNLQASYGAEFFDYEAACGQYDKTMPPSDAVEDFGMANTAWNEPWDGFSMTSDNNVASHDTFEGFETSETAWAGMEPTQQQHQPSTTTIYNLPEDSNLWTSDSGNFQNNDFAFQSSVPTEAHNYPNFDTLQQMAPGSSEWHAQDQQVLPAEGHQSDDNFRPNEFPAAARDQFAIQDSATTFPRRVLSCGWTSCGPGHCVLRGDEAEAKHHLTFHKDVLLQFWNGPTTCGWPKCSSSRTFKHKYALSDHIANIHVAPLYCPITGCSVGPFGKKSDLNRHLATIHDKRIFFCPVESCQARATSFPRKDKLVRHMREDHDNVRCSLNHCGRVIPDGQQESHLQNCHGDWECPLMACQHGRPSNFTIKAAQLHLINVHKMNPYTAWNAIYLSPYHTPADHTIRLERLSRKPIKQLAECQRCLGVAPKAS